MDPYRMPGERPDYPAAPEPPPPPPPPRPVERVRSHLHHFTVTNLDHVVDPLIDRCQRCGAMVDDLEDFPRFCP